MDVSSQPFSVLIIDDEKNMLDMLNIALSNVGYEIETASNGRDGLKKITGNYYHCILCDIKMPIMDGLQFLDEFNKLDRDCPVIMMSAFATVELAVKAMRDGAYDFITKPFKIDEIICVLERARELVTLKRDNQVLRYRLQLAEEASGFENLIGKSKKLLEVIALAQRVAVHDSTVLITGESGTGKELIAKGIHLASKRQEGQFVTVNCGAIPVNLLEAELFGYVKGAFTGADNEKTGLISLASGGTIFLDEIGELQLEMQVKLLRVLQEREIRPIGAVKSNAVNIRVVAATSRKLEEEVAAGRFRDDLYFRLNVVRISVPPLRERLDDLPLLIDYFIRKESHKLEKHITGAKREYVETLMAHEWPGNVRELRNTIEYSIVCADGERIGIEDLPVNLVELVARTKVPSAMEPYKQLAQAKAELERRMIESALIETEGNKSKASVMLGISYPSLLKKIKEFHLD